MRVAQSFFHPSRFERTRAVWRALRHPFRARSFVCPNCDGQAAWRNPTDYGTGWEWSACAGCDGHGRVSLMRRLRS